MGDFSDTMHLKGKVEEDLYFARLERERVAAIHAGENKAATAKTAKPGDSEKPAKTAAPANTANSFFW